MLSQLGHAPRFVRLTILVTIVILVPTLYLLYPTPEYVPSPGEVQAGGIDSDHWRAPIQPDLNLGAKDYQHGVDGTEQEHVREWQDGASSAGGHDDQRGWKGVSEETLSGGVIMPKLGNETAKAELGRSAWRVLHLMTLRYPDEPTPDDRQALKSYFHLFSRLYPCGECAAEFQTLLKEYPPQTSSRKSASLWLCHVHNLVNARLGKPEFDCLTLDATYDCGCGDESASATLDGDAAKDTALASDHETLADAVVEAEVERTDVNGDGQEEDRGYQGPKDREHGEVHLGPEDRLDEIEHNYNAHDDDHAKRPIPHGHEIEEDERDYDDNENNDDGNEEETATHDREAIDRLQRPRPQGEGEEWGRDDQQDDKILDTADGGDDDGIDDEAEGESEAEVKRLGSRRGDRQ